MSARRRRRNKSTGSNPPAAKAQKKAVPKPPRSALSRRRKWLFRLTVMVLAPVLFFTVLEAGLRLGGYGYPTTFLMGPDADGIYTSNFQFGWRFFPRSLARTPAPCLLSTKPAGVVRIFILGSSAAQGVPDPSFSVGRILEVLLRERYPEMKFEVINAAMTAINSHVALEIARDCAAHQPDLFVVYMGNNEVVGPYGPGTVFQQWSPSLTFIRANIWVKSTRIGQLLGDAMDWFRPRKVSPRVWRGMEMFLGNQVAADDPRLPAVYDNFRQNLMDICGIARRAGAGAILSTVAVNLKDCPPFASAHRSDLSPEDLAKWESIYRAGVEFESNKKWQESIAKYEAAARIDDRFAELPFRMGRCLAALGRSAEARDRFASARDLDALRFRADSRINAIIREVASDQEGAGVRLVDAEQSLARSALAAGGILGEGLFYEHVHFTFDGNYLLARAVLDEVEAALPQLAAARKQEAVLSREQCAELMSLTSWDEYQMAKLMAEMTSRPPFTGQLDHAVRQASAQKRTEELSRLAFTREAIRAACKSYEAALEKTPDDCYLHHNFGKLALASGQPEVAAEHLGIVRKKWSWEPLVHNDLGNAEGDCGRIDEAMAEYQKALEIDPECAIAHHNLGNTLNSLGRTDEAMAEYQKALEIDPALTMAHINLANALRSRGRLDEAIVEFQKALEIDPNLAIAHNNLGNALRSRGQLDEAVAEFQKALEIDPGCVSAHYNLANTLNGSGRTDEAIAEFQKALEIDPKFVMAHNNLGNALASRGRIDEAIAHFRKALESDPNSALSHNNLGLALLRCKQLDEAVVHFQKAVEIKPDFAEARANLRKTLKMRDQGSGRR